jgi:hypothetical protein
MSVPPRDERLRQRVQALRRQLDAWHCAPHGPRLRIRSGHAALDRLLPAGGFTAGTLVEWLSPGPGSGAGTLALGVASQACQHPDRRQGALVVMDRQVRFYPPAALAAGIDPRRLILVRARSARDELWALDQALRCRGVAAVWAWLGRLDSRAFRRLQLAAESGGTLGLLVRPARVRGQPSWSEVQLLVQPQPAVAPSRLPAALHEPASGVAVDEPAGRRLRVTLLRCRGLGGAGEGVLGEGEQNRKSEGSWVEEGGTVELEIDPHRGPISSRCLPDRHGPQQASTRWRGEAG